LPKPAWWSLAVWSPKPRVLSPQCSPRHPSLLSSDLSQQDFLLYTQFSYTHPSSILSSIHYIHCKTHLSPYLNISMCDLVLKDLLRRI
jgi:hypothetical protein